MTKSTGYKKRKNQIEPWLSILALFSFYKSKLKKKIQKAAQHNQIMFTENIKA